MRILTSLTLLFILMAAPVAATPYPYALGGGGGLTQFNGGDLFKLESQSTFGFSLGHKLTSHWWFDLEYSAAEFTNDSMAAFSDSVGALANNSPLELDVTRLGATISARLFHPDHILNPIVGAGGGLLIWKGVDPATTTTYVVTGDRKQATDFSATELFLTGQAGLVFQPHDRLSLQLLARADYLTSAGANFDSELNSSRDRFLISGLAKVYFHFGRADVSSAWRSDRAWDRQESRPVVNRVSVRDGDGDGVEDSEDACLNTPPGVTVDRNGCPIDSDHDGVPDGLDDCPGTLSSARGAVDIHGCPVDSDFDGLADYEDECPYNEIGSIVDSKGCPTDSDNDGVPDGLDDCPYTLVGVEVDKRGCIDLGIFSQPMVLNIDYPSGSFEIDPHNKERVKRLAGLLNFVRDYRLEINGYTDNVGTESANRDLSEKRANRVKGYLISLGVEEDRIKVFGRGESSFVASNQTAEGRAKNRRIEIVFYK